MLDRIKSIVLCGALGVLCLSGCADSSQRMYLDGRVPHDFNVSIRVVNSTVSDDGQYVSGLRKPGCYLLDTDRSIHCITGVDVGARTYPPVIRIADPEEVEKVYRVVYEHNLMSEPTSVKAEDLSDGDGGDKPDVIYHVELTSGGRTSIYSTTAAESPGTVRLLRVLIELVNGRISGAGKGL